MLPGFVDSHTHPVFTQPRLVDFEKRIAGANYEEIAEAGGGIRSSIEGVRGAGKDMLTEISCSRRFDMARHGTTTVEAKSGYGLSFESELKSLEAIRALRGGGQGRWCLHCLVRILFRQSIADGRANMSRLCARR